MNKKIVFIFPKDSSAIFDKKSIETFGGATVQMFLLAKEFSNYEDVEVSSLVVDLGQKNEDIINGLKLYKTFSKKDNLLLKIIKFHKAIQKVKPDAIIQHGLTIFSCLLAVYCKIFKIKFVYMFASDVEADGYYQTDHKKARLLKLLINYGDILVTQNQYQHDKILNKYNRKTNKLYSGFPIENSYSNNREFVLWVAMCGKWKRPDKFIKLASLNSNYNFVIVCNKVVGQEDYFSNIQQLAEDVGNLEFLRRVPFGKIETYFKKAKIFVNTSDYEGFPQTFIQATKNKVPIISLNVNPDNFITKYKCGIYCNGNEKWMNQSIRELLKDPQKYSSLSENAYQYAKKNHDIKKNAKYLYNLIFDELMKKNRIIKICFALTYAYPLFNKKLEVTYGGAEMQTYLLANEMSKHFRVDYIVGDFGQRDIEFNNNIRVIKYFKPTDNFINQFIKLFMSLLKSNADIYIQRSLNRGTFIISIFCLIFRKKFIYMVASDSETDGSFEKDKTIFSKMFYSMGLKLSSMILCQSDEEKKNMIKFKKASGKKIRIMKKGLIIPKTNSESKEIDGIWVGRCIKSKKPELFLKLAQENKNKRFCIICPPAQTDLSYFKEIKARCSSIPNLEFKKRLPNKEVIEYLKRSKAFILTSEKEGELPMVVLEALSCGIPVISVFINPERILTNEKIGICLDGDETKLNITFQRFIDSTEQLTKYSERAKRYIQDNRDIKKVANEFKQILAELGAKS